MPSESRPGTSRGPARPGDLTSWFCRDRPPPPPPPPPQSRDAPSSQPLEARPPGRKLCLVPRVPLVQHLAFCRHDAPGRGGGGGDVPCLHPPPVALCSSRRVASSRGVNPWLRAFLTDPQRAAVRRTGVSVSVSVKPARFSTGAKGQSKHRKKILHIAKYCNILCNLCVCVCVSCVRAHACVCARVRVCA